MTGVNALLGLAAAGTKWYLLAGREGYKHPSPLFKCWFCGHRAPAKFREPVFSKSSSGRWVLSGEAGAHFFTTHGFDPDTMIDMLRSVCRGRVHAE